MPGLRYSLRKLLATVAVSAMVSSYLATAFRLEVGTLRSMTLGTLVLAIAWALSGRGRARAFALGFAVVGWLYYVASNAGRPTGLASNRWLEVAYDSIVGFPVALAPEDVAGFMRQLVSFLTVGHHLLTMFLATTGGLITLTAWSLTRRVAEPRGDTRTAVLDT